MRAILVREFGAPAVMRVEDVPTPPPGPSQVLVHVRAAGVNPVDTYIRSGVYAIKPPLPYTPGIDGAGDVAVVGSDVHHVKAGDRVYFFNDNTASGRTGSYAEYALLGATQVRPLPARVSYAQGAALGVPYATVYYGLLKRGQAKAGETVLVHGASGGVGIGAVQVARAHGMTVIGTAGSARGMDAVAHAGAHVVLDHKDPHYLEAISKATAGRGVDVVLEMNAHLNLDKDLSLVARGGRIVLIGNRGRIEIDPRLIMAREAAVVGMVLFNVTPPDFQWMHAAIGAGLENGVVRPLVGRELPLDEAPAAHEAVMTPGALGKIVLTT